MSLIRCFSLPTSVPSLLQAKRRDSPAEGSQKASDHDSKQVPPEAQFPLSLPLDGAVRVVTLYTSLVTVTVDSQSAWFMSICNRLMFLLPFFLNSSVSCVLCLNVLKKLYLRNNKTSERLLRGDMRGALGGLSASVSRGPVTKPCRWELKEQKLILSQSGGRKSQIRVSAGPVPSEGREGRLVPRLSSACRRRPLCVSSRHFPSVSVSVFKVPIFIRTPVMLIRTHPTDVIVTRFLR